MLKVSRFHCFCMSRQCCIATVLPSDTDITEHRAKTNVHASKKSKYEGILLKKL